MKREALYGRISPAWLPGKGIGDPAAEKLKTGGISVSEDARCTSFCLYRCDLCPYRGRFKIVLRLFLKYGILGAAMRGD